MRINSCARGRGSGSEGSKVSVKIAVAVVMSWKERIYGLQLTAMTRDMYILHTIHRPLI